METATARVGSRPARLPAVPVDVEADGFFALRTPVLPWSALDDLDGGGLATLLADPLVRDALFVASPDLVDALAANADLDPKRRRAITRYVARMAGRPTPFGLFAACSVGTLGAATSLALGERLAARSRVGMDVLFAAVDALTRDPAVRAELLVEPNSTLHRIAGRWQYVEARVGVGGGRTHHLVGADDGSELSATLERARAGALPCDLAAALCAEDRDLDADEAAGFVDELLDAQLLVARLAVPVTGDGALAAVARALVDVPAAATVRAALDTAAAALEAMDAAPPGERSRRTRALAAALAPVPAEIALDRLVQVDTVRAARATLDRAVVDDLLRGVELLRATTPAMMPPELRGFVERFVERHGGEELPLLDALDEEVGVGFSAADEYPPPSADAALLALVDRALREHALKVVPTQIELQRLAIYGAPPLPGAFAVVARPAADGQVQLVSVYGPSGARMLARFCDADQALHAHVSDHLRREEALDPDAVFAEVVHLPEGRLGNILARPALRDHEIAFLGSGAAPAQRRIALDDLLVSIVDGAPMLRSRRLRRRVEPRLSTAHNFFAHGLPVYRFLALLQAPWSSGFLGWWWGAAAQAPFTPRVRVGRVVLALATWRLGHEEAAALQEPGGVEAARASLGLPRWIASAVADNLLPMDLDTAWGRDLLADEARRQGTVTIVEQWPAPDALAAAGPDGRHAAEVIVPFTSAARAVTSRASPNHSPVVVTRAFPPGSSWLYAKLYSGPALCDALLRDVVGALVDAVDAVEAVEWHFVRFADPDHHLRLRFHGDPAVLAARIRPAIELVAAAEIERGRLRRLAFDTYEREIDRYGGSLRIADAEAIFHADSVAALAILRGLGPGDAAQEQRALITLAGLDLLLRDAGLDRETGLALLRDLRAAFGIEQGIGREGGRALGRAFREQRAALEQALASGHPALSERSRRTAAAWAQYGEAGPTIVASVMHMWVNRMARSDPRGLELVLYDQLERLWTAAAARERAR